MVYKSARAITEEECVSIAKAYGVMEEKLQVPHSLRVTQVALLPKSDEQERPISLTSIWWRVYTKLRRSLLEDWMREYKTRALHDAAVPGQTCLDVAVRRLVHTEYQRTRSVHVISLFGYCRLLRHCSTRPGLEKGPGVAVSPSPPLPHSAGLPWAKGALRGRGVFFGALPSARLVAGLPFGPQHK